MARSYWATPLDAAFLVAETPETLMHVGSLLHFRYPDGADEQFLRDLAEDLRSSPVEPPWSLRLQTRRFLRQPVHRFVEDESVDMGYHVRRSALPTPGGERELGILVSRLHSNQIDFRRPPWELHLIEGVAPGRFAVYVKIHHSLVDGFTAMRFLRRGLSEDPTDLEHPHFFSLRRRPRSEDAKPEPVGDVASVLRSVSAAVTNLPTVARTVAETQLRRGQTSTRAVTSYQAPRSVLNGRTGRARRFATQQYDLDRMRAVAKAKNVTLNDVLLAVCAGGLRRYLGDLDALPDRPLIGFVPVNVRADSSDGGGNYVGATLVSLATDIEDPLARLAAIAASSRAAKARMRGMDGDAVIAYSAMLLAPAAIQVTRAMSGLPLPIPLTLNVCISNVPGPTKPLYWRGARLEATYPVSIPGHSMALNITAQSYAGTLNVGFVGDRDSVPHLQRLAVATGEAMAELEAAIRST